MPEPELTEAQLMLRSAVREFLAREVAPICRELERRPDPRDCMPWDLIRAGSRLGLRTLALPESWGGAGANVTTRAMVLAEMCQVEPGLAKCFYSCWRSSLLLYHLGTRAQREKFLKPFAEDDAYCFSTAFTEPEAGSDNLIASDDPKRGLMLSAVRDGKNWVLNGRKQWVSLAGLSRSALVFARTDPNLPVHRGSTLFIVPSDWPGVRFPRVDDKLGFRLYPNGDIALENARLPEDHRLGEVNGAWAGALRLFAGAVDYPATSLGLAKAMHRIALDYARHRLQGGRRLIGHPTIGSRLAEMRMHLHAMEGYLWDTARAIDGGGPFDPNHTWLLKVHCDRAAVQVMLGALEVTGGNGVMKEFPLERFCRDVLTSLHSDGTESLNLLRSAQSLLRENPA
ncbi:MAG: acyl-CoA dehydrogenase family protein [Nitrospinota bacterium]